MAQKPNHQKSPQPKRKGGTWNAAMNILLAGCFAEFYLLLIRRFYVYGTDEQLIAWDSGLKIAAIIALAVLVAGGVMTVLYWKKPGWKKWSGEILLGAGAFVAVTAWIAWTYYATAITLLCVVVPAVMLLGILWSLYDRECAWALTILGGDVLALWICRRGLRSLVWHTPVMIGAVCAIVLCAAAAAVFFLADRKGGKLGKVQLLPSQGDPLVIYIACGLSVVTLVMALVSISAAYYALWGAVVSIFAIAAYYTVRQL